MYINTTFMCHKKCICKCVNSCTLGICYPDAESPLTKLTTQLPGCGTMWHPHYRWNWSGIVCGGTHGCTQSWESTLRTQRSLEQEQSSNTNTNCGVSHPAATQESTVRTVAEAQQKRQPGGSFHVCIANQRWGANRPSCQREGQGKPEKESGSKTFWKSRDRFSKNKNILLQNIFFFREEEWEGVEEGKEEELNMHFPMSTLCIWVLVSPSWFSRLYLPTGNICMLWQLLHQGHSEGLGMPVCLLVPATKAYGD